jgi:hypothetical protein
VEPVVHPGRPHAERLPYHAITMSCIALHVDTPMVLRTSCVVHRTARALLTGSGRTACGDLRMLPGETTDEDENHSNSLR